MLQWSRPFDDDAAAWTSNSGSPAPWNMSCCVFSLRTEHCCTAFLFWEPWKSWPSIEGLKIFSLEIHRPSAVDLFVGTPTKQCSWILEAWIYPPRMPVENEDFQGFRIPKPKNLSWWWRLHPGWGVDPSHSYSCSGSRLCQWSPGPFGSLILGFCSPKLLRWIIFPRIFLNFLSKKADRSDRFLFLNVFYVFLFFSDSSG